MGWIFILLSHCSTIASAKRQTCVISLEIILLGLWCLTTFSTIFQGVSFIGGGNGSTRREPPTLPKSLASLTA